MPRDRAVDTVAKLMLYLSEYRGFRHMLSEQYPEDRREMILELRRIVRSVYEPENLLKAKEKK